MRAKIEWSPPMLRIAIMVLALAAMTDAASAQCAGGDWRCQHNEFSNRMMNSAAPAPYVPAGPGVLDWLQFFSQQSAAEQQRQETVRQRAVKVDALKQALGDFDRFGAKDRALMCQQIYPAALNQGLLDVGMSRTFWSKCRG